MSAFIVYEGSYLLKGFFKRHLRSYSLYLIRWQLSTPILAPVVAYFSHSPTIFGTTESWIGSAVANLIGGLIFYWFDGKLVFKSPIFEKPVWEIQENTTCTDCGTENIRGYRLILADGYDKTQDPNPEFRCEKCSAMKYKEMFLKT